MLSMRKNPGGRGGTSSRQTPADRADLRRRFPLRGMVRLAGDMFGSGSLL